MTNPEAAAILSGDFDPTTYISSNPISDLYQIDGRLTRDILPDSLLSYLLQLSVFENRNTGSDTLSMEFGIGAAQRWAFNKFQTISSENENRLIPSYLQFDQLVCGMGRHKNVFAVLPGSGPHFDEVIIIEAHLDSRCEDVCDIDCPADGMEDNGSGSALVMELARVMSPFTFDRTIVFMLTTGEEQGLVGANAFSQFAKDTDMKIKGVLNNDVIGGITCGETASPPGCPGLNDIDSINVRIFSFGSQNNRNKQLARYVKLQFNEMTRDSMNVKPVINIMTPEDRTGRGGDHIPFREDGFAAIRFTSANEHGNANASDPDYHDRQHTRNDILGVDTDGDDKLDSFFVDFNYLSRNAMINGTGAASLASAPISPYDFDMEDIPGGFVFDFKDSIGYGTYRVAVRQFDIHDWDTLITIHTLSDTIRGFPSNTFYAVSVMSVDDNGIESTPSNEKWGSFESGVSNVDDHSSTIELIQNRPNPFDEATIIGVHVRQMISHDQAFIVFRNTSGKELIRIPILLQEGLSEIEYDYNHHGYQPGTYFYSLVIDGRIIDTKSMVYAY
jgi:hypothetical protein